VATTAAPAAVPAGSDPNYAKWIDPNAWQVTLLTEINVPISKTNVTIINAWAQSEQPPGWTPSQPLNGNNPLAISGLNPGATHCIAQCNGSSPVMAYDTLANGVAATAKFITGNHGAYQGIVQAMQNPFDQTDGTSKAQIQTASGVIGAVWTQINISGWCKGCQGGRYPTALYSVFTKSESLPVNANPSGGPSAAQLVGGAASEAASAGAGAVGSAVSTTLSDILGVKINWGAIGTFALGSAVFVTGLVIFISNTKTGRNIERTAAVAAAA
jgi:hypothetical protein